MHVYHNLESVPHNISTVLSIGKFDGVHIGHREIIKALNERAGILGATSAIVTFDPHPDRVIRPESCIRVLTPLRVKLELLESLGLGAAFVLPFTHEFAAMSPVDFVRLILVEKLHVREIHEGGDFHFGKGASAGNEELLRLGKTYDFRVQIHSSVRCGSMTVSSNTIRGLLADGQFDLTGLMLARNFQDSSSDSATSRIYAQVLPPDCSREVEKTVPPAPPSF